MALPRSLLFLLWMGVTVIPYAIAVLLASIVQRGAPLYWMCVAWLRLVVGGARWICGVRYRVQGMENVPTASSATAAVILAPKHQSTWETFALPVLMPHPLAYVFKKELLQIPFFGWAMGRLDMIHIDRSKRAEAWAKVAEQGARRGQMAAFHQVFGDPIDPALWAANDPLLQARKVDPKAVPALYLDCGAEDRYGLANGHRALDRILSERGVAHVFELPPGDHGYEYVLTVFEKGLGFLTRALTVSAR